MDIDGDPTVDLLLIEVKSPKLQSVYEISRAARGILCCVTDSLSSSSRPGQTLEFWRCRSRMFGPARFSCIWSTISFFVEVDFYRLVYTLNFKIFGYFLSYFIGNVVINCTYHFT